MQNRQRKDGRVDECVCLENRRSERTRGFESLSFRKETPTECYLKRYIVAICDWHLS
nr:MAG TPA: hypothetical protein [Caudoviricetes sp.]